MSASREKKQRQGAGLSEKALQAQQQQAARKRKNILYTVIGAVAVVLVAALLIWRSSRNGLVHDLIAAAHANDIAATVGDTKLTAAEMSYYYYNAKMEAYYNEFYYYLYLGLDVPSDSAVRDSATGQTYRDYYMEAALRNAQESMALAEEAKKNGHTEAEVKGSLDAQVQRLKAEAAANNYSYSAYLKAMCGDYMSAKVYEKLYTRDLLANLIYSEKRAELLDSYTEADFKAYYEADDHADTLDTFEYSYLYFTPAEVEDKDGDGNDRDKDTVAELEKLELAKANTNAKAAQEALKKALEEDPKAFAEEDSISKFAEEEYELKASNYSSHAAGVGVTSAPSAIREKLLNMKENDVELVENGESGYYVVILHSRKLVQDPTKDVRHILALAETTTDADGKLVVPTAEAWAAAEATIKDIQAEYEAGAKTEDSFAALANKYSDDGDGTTGGLYPDIGPDDGYVSEFLEWIYTDGRQVGDTGIVKHDPGNVTKGYWGYHLMYFVGDGDNKPVWMRTARNALTAEALDDWLEGLRDNFPAALADGAGIIGR